MPRIIVLIITNFNSAAVTVLCDTTNMLLVHQDEQCQSKKPTVGLTRTNFAAETVDNNKKTSHTCKNFGSEQIRA